MKKIKTMAITAAIISIIISNVYADKSLDSKYEGELTFENEYLKFHLDPKTTEFYITNKKTNTGWNSNPIDRNELKVSAEIKKIMSSQFDIIFYDNMNREFKMNNWADAAEKNQFEIKKIDNGFRIEYILGRMEKRSIVPQIIEKSRFEELILKPQEDERALRRLKKLYKFYSLSEIKREEDKKKILKEYPMAEQYDFYVARPMKTREKRDIGEYLKTAGYTIEDKDYDHSMFDFIEEEEVYARFTIPVEYTIENNALIVRFPVSEIEYDEEFYLHKLSLLNYLGAADSSTDGYIMVPDGCGSLIYTKDKNRNTSNLSLKVYGRNNVISTDFEKFMLFNEKAGLPVYGMKRDEDAYLAVIESSDAQASIDVKTSQGENKYFSVWPSFTITDKDYYRYEGLSEKDGVFVFESDGNKDDILVKYFFIPEKNAGYVQMADTYRNYLIDKGALRALDRKKGAPFYLEVVGAIEKTEPVFGIPVDRRKKVTSYLESIDIMESLQGRGIGNIHLKYSGWMNGGLKNTVPNKISYQKELGGKKDFEKLLDYINNNGISLYPDVDFCYTEVNRFFDGFTPRSDASIGLDKRIAVHWDMEKGLISNYSYPQYIISPLKLNQYMDNFLKNFRKNKLDTVSLGTLGGNLNGDYNNKNPVNRENAKKMVVESLGKNFQDMDIMFDEGFSYILPYAGHILDMPMSSSNYTIADETIPFYQIVVRGYINYAGKPLNLAENSLYEIMKSLETGAGLYYLLNFAENEIIKNTTYTYLYSTNYILWADEASRAYKLFSEVLSDVFFQPISNHEKIDDGVYRTTYKNGIKIMVDYNKYTVSVNNREIKVIDALYQE